MTPTLRFSDLNPVGQGIIIIVAVLTAGVAAASFATSYGALYAFIRDTGLYSPQLARLWPLLLDAAFIIAQLTAILGKILRGSRFWPILTMIVTGGLTVWFNLQHAGADPGRRLAAVIPPVLMILAFETDVAIVKWVMSALGKPLDSTAPTTHLLRPAMPAHEEMPWSAYAENGHLGPELGGGVGPTKRVLVESYLARTGAGNRTPREIAAGLAGEGTPVSERYIYDLLGKRPSSRNGKGRP